MFSLSHEELCYPANLLVVCQKVRDPIPHSLFSELDDANKGRSRTYSDCVPVVDEEYVDFHSRVLAIQSCRSLNLIRHLMAAPQFLNPHALVDGRVRFIDSINSFLIKV